MNAEQILKEAKPRPWTEESLRAACNLALTGKARINQNDLRLIVLAVNSYEAREARIASLEAMLRRIAVDAHEPDKWPMEFSEFRSKTAAALAAATKVQP